MFLLSVVALNRMGVEVEANVFVCVIWDMHAFFTAVAMATGDWHRLPLCKARVIQLPTRDGAGYTLSIPRSGTTVSFTAGNQSIYYTIASARFYDNFITSRTERVLFVFPIILPM